MAPTQAEIEAQRKAAAAAAGTGDNPYAGAGSGNKFNTGLISQSTAGGYTGIPASVGAPTAIMATADSKVPMDFLGQGYNGPVPTWGEYDMWLKVNAPDQYAGVKKMMKAGKYSSWSSVLKAAAFTNAPVFEFLQDQAATIGAGGSGTGGPYTTSQTNVSLSSESQAAATLDQMYQQELGRTADDKEIAAFKKALNAAQMQSPSKSVTSGFRSGSGSSSSSTKTTGGFDPTRFAREYAQSQEGFGERYAGITFMDALDKAISSPNTLDQMAGNL